MKSIQSYDLWSTSDTRTRTACFCFRWLRVVSYGLWWQTLYFGLLIRKGNLRKEYFWGVVFVILYCWVHRSQQFKRIKLSSILYADVWDGKFFKEIDPMFNPFFEYWQLSKFTLESPNISLSLSRDPFFFCSICNHCLSFTHQTLLVSCF